MSHSIFRAQPRRLPISRRALLRANRCSLAPRAWPRACSPSSSAPRATSRSSLRRTRASASRCSLSSSSSARVSCRSTLTWRSVRPITVTSSMHPRARRSPLGLRSRVRAVRNSRMSESAPAAAAPPVARVRSALPWFARGDLVGEHRVLFAGAGEQLELTHRATDRGVFARSALKAARWLVGRSPGHYSMRDIIFRNK